MLEHPSRFINDVAVAGVKGDRFSDELVPRAWVVLSRLGKQQGAEAVFAALDEWTRSRLSKHKWLRGGIQITDEVGDSYIPRAASKRIDAVYVRYRDPQLERYCVVSCRTSILGVTANATVHGRSCEQKTCRSPTHETRT